MSTGASLKTGRSINVKDFCFLVFCPPTIRDRGRIMDDIFGLKQVGALAFQLHDKSSRQHVRKLLSRVGIETSTSRVRRDTDVRRVHQGPARSQLLVPNTILPLHYRPVVGSNNRRKSLELGTKISRTLIPYALAMELNEATEAPETPRSTDERKETERP
jgi:hypothetical protein